MMNFKLSIKSILLCFFTVSCLLTLSSCSDDEPSAQETATNHLEGSWDVTSYTEDGEENIGSFFSSVELDFEKTATGEGDFRWINKYEDGDTEVANGEYKINVEGDELELTSQDEDETLVYTFDVLQVDSDDLRLEGTIDGFRYIIVAKK